VTFWFNTWLGDSSVIWLATVTFTLLFVLIVCFTSFLNTFSFLLLALLLLTGGVDDDDDDDDDDFLGVAFLVGTYFSISSSSLLLSTIVFTADFLLREVVLEVVVGIVISNDSFSSFGFFEGFSSLFDIAVYIMIIRID
jgi:hypothetical protein